MISWLYLRYEDLRNTNNMFLFKGNQILKFKTIRDNMIQNGDIVKLVRQKTK